jgi:hypothetical protein
MSEEFVVYGIIDAGQSGAGEKYNRHHQLNRDVINSLQSNDGSPRITRSMFSIPGAEVTFRSQIIHFAASYNFLDIEQWTQKFERLLRQLYWFSATVHIESEMGWAQRLEWVIDDQSMKSLSSEPPLPVSTWFFSMLDE